ncbi:stress responsive protein [Labrys miyagiensis]|uniref:Stress responsive protein n=1 Tax=Labrys miyagiensis TaxID=346912 RepID=A0ABQ6CEP0_9HYPH|nr:Dabb family protein [Labrys miyagiensis]GLS18635.1 stress responsive protein [Labrys miyagiensis]
MIRHIVLANLRGDLSPAEKESLFAALAGMKEHIPGIVAVTVGANNSPEGLDRGHSHGFTVDFVDAAARDAYLPHPHHVKVGTQLVGATEGGVGGLLVLDYEV